MRVNKKSFSPRHNNASLLFLNCTEKLYGQAANESNYEGYWTQFRAHNKLIT